jgi:hypothetical protein
MKKYVRPKHDGARAEIKKVLAAKYEVSLTTISNALKGYSQTEQSELIKKDYDKMYKKVAEALA